MRPGRGAIVLIDLDERSTKPLHRRIYESLRQQIVDGRLPRGARLPSTRSLAADLRVSRSTIVQAFEQLRAEGNIEAISRGATRVSDKLPDALLSAEPAVAAPQQSGVSPVVSKRAAAVASAWPEFSTISDRPPRAFRTSVPALDVFPVDLRGRLTARRWRRSPPGSLAYSDPRGLAALRRAIADYRRSAHGVRCHADQVMVTCGSQHALDTSPAP